MSSQPTRSRATSGPGYARSLPRRDWDLLVGLPAHVLAAVTALETDPDRAGVPDALVGMAAIAAGRSRPGRLIPEVVTAIYGAHEADVAAGPLPAGAVLARCVVAGEVLAERVPATEAAAYRRWVLDIAAALVRGRGTGRYPGHRIGPAQLRLLDEIERALAG